MLVFLGATLVATAAATAAAPAVFVGRGDLPAALGDAGRGAIGSARRGRRALVVAQVAIAVIVIAGAGGLVRAFADLNRISPRLAPDCLLLVDLSPPERCRSRGATRCSTISPRVSARMAGIAPHAG